MRGSGYTTLSTIAIIIIIISSSSYSRTDVYMHTLRTPFPTTPPCIRCPLSPTMSASSIATFAGDRVLYLTSATLTGAKPNTVECVKAIREIFTSFRVFGIRGLTCDKLCWNKSQQLNLVIEGPLLARERLCALRAILGVSVLPDVASPGRILYVIIVSHDDIKTLFNRISRTRPMSIKLRNEEPKADGPHKGMCYFGVRYYLDDISDSLELFKAGLRESLEPRYPVVDMSLLNDSANVSAAFHPAS